MPAGAEPALVRDFTPLKHSALQTKFCEIICTICSRAMLSDWCIAWLKYVLILGSLFQNVDVNTSQQRDLVLSQTIKCLSIFN